MQYDSIAESGLNYMEAFEGDTVPKTDSDQHELITRAQQGDLDAYSLLVSRYQDMAVGYAYSILGDFHLAEDAAQEAFVEACRTIGQLQSPAAYAAWFRRVVFKHCDRMTRRKRLAAEPLYAAEQIADPSDDPLAAVIKEEERSAVRTAVAALPTTLRETVTLFYIADYSQKEIAAFIGTPVTTVQKRLYEGRRHLKERMLNMAKKAIHDQAPSRDNAFLDAVGLCNAAQAGDGLRVARILDEKPELVGSPHPTQAREPIHYAAREGHSDVVRLLIDRGADPLKGIYPKRDTANALALARDRGHEEAVAVIEAWMKDRHQVIPLGEQIFAAVAESRFDEARTLLDAHPDLLKAVDTEGATLIHCAAEGGAWRFILELKDRGLDIDLPDNNRIRPVQVALSRRWMAEPSADLVTAAVLLGAGAQYDFWTACAMGDLDTVRSRLAEDPSLASYHHCRDVNPWSRWFPLTKAALEGHEEIVRLLLDAGADPDAYMETSAPLDVEGKPLGFPESGLPLIYAMAKNHTAIAHLLLDRGASIHGAMYAGDSVEDMAFSQGDDELIERFLRLGTKPTFDQVFAVSGRKAAAIAPYIARAAENLSPDRTVEMPWGGDTLGNIIHWAVSGGELTILSMCLVHQPVFTDLQWFDLAWETMRTGYDRQRKNRVEALRALLEYGLDPNIKHRENETLLHWISSTEWWSLSDAQTVQFAEALAAYGADVNAMDDESLSTPLSWAVRYGREALVGHLLEHGADPNLGGGSWAKPLSWAERKGNTAIADLLKSIGARA